MVVWWTALNQPMKTLRFFPNTLKLIGLLLFGRREFKLSGLDQGSSKRLQIGKKILQICP